MVQVLDSESGGYVDISQEEYDRRVAAGYTVGTTLAPDSASNEAVSPDELAAAGIEHVTAPPPPDSGVAAPVESESAPPAPPPAVTIPDIMSKGFSYAEAKTILESPEGDAWRTLAERGVIPKGSTFVSYDPSTKVLSYRPPPHVSSEFHPSVRALWAMVPAEVRGGLSADVAKWNYEMVAWQTKVDAGGPVPSAPLPPKSIMVAARFPQSRFGLVPSFGVAAGTVAAESAATIGGIPLAVLVGLIGLGYSSYQALVKGREMMAEFRRVPSLPDVESIPLEEVKADTETIPLVAPKGVGSTVADIFPGKDMSMSVGGITETFDVGQIPIQALQPKPFPVLAVDKDASILIASALKDMPITGEQRSLVEQAEDNLNRARVAEGNRMLAGILGEMEARGVPVVLPNQGPIASALEGLRTFPDYVKARDEYLARSSDISEKIDVYSPEVVGVVESSPGVFPTEITTVPIIGPAPDGEPGVVSASGEPAVEGAPAVVTGIGTSTEPATGVAAEPATGTATQEDVATGSAADVARTASAIRTADLTRTAEAARTAEATRTARAAPLPLLLGGTTSKDEGKRRIPVPRGSIAWRQGFVWKYIPPPWDQDKPFSLSAPPVGAVVGGRTPRETIQIIGSAGSPVPRRVDIDLGWTDITIVGGRRIVFSGHGVSTDVGRRIVDETKGMSVKEDGMAEYDGYGEGYVEPAPEQSPPVAPATSGTEDVLDAGIGEDDLSDIFEVPDTDEDLSGVTELTPEDASDIFEVGDALEPPSLDGNGRANVVSRRRRPLRRTQPPSTYGVRGLTA